MSNTDKIYRMILDDTAVPPMYGIAWGEGPAVRRISTDSQEVSRLTEQCNRGGLSPVHLLEVVEDFRKS